MGEGDRVMGSERLETDKLTADYTLRIPEVTKAALDKLSKSWRRKLNERLLVTIASVLHEATFDPRRYLVEGYFDDSPESK